MALQTAKKSVKKSIIFLSFKFRSCVLNFFCDIRKPKTNPDACGCVSCIIMRINRCKMVGTLKSHTANFYKHRIYQCIYSQLISDRIWVSCGKMINSPSSLFSVLYYYLLPQVAHYHFVKLTS